MRAITLPPDADAVFAVGGVGGIAFAGVVGAAEAAGVRQSFHDTAGRDAQPVRAQLLEGGSTWRLVNQPRTRQALG